MNDIVLSIYPLSSDFRSRLQRTTGAGVEYLSIGQLRAMTVGKMVAHLRTLNPNLLTLAFEDKDSGALSPVLKLIAGLTRARRLAVAWPDAEPVPFKRRNLVNEAFGLVCATGESLASALATRLDLHAPCTPVPMRADHAARGARKALYLNANLWFGVKAGGSVGHISGVANGLMNAGYALDFATCGGRLMVDQRANVVRLTPPATFGLPSELNYFRFSRMVERELAASLTMKSYDFIYQRLSVANYSGMKLSRAFGVPLVIEYNGSEVWVAQNWGSGLRFASLALRAEEQTLRAAHVVVTVSDVLRDELVARGIPRERIVSYPNCINPELFDPVRYSESDATALRLKHGIPRDAVLATFVGTFGPWHGAEVLARAIRQLAASRADWLREHKLHFLFVGDGGRCAETKRILAEDVSKGHVTFAGLIPQAEAPRYLAASDVLLSPHVPNADGTKFFGSPTKLFEYMAMGKPIIASDLDQVGDVLKRGLHAADLPTGQPAMDASEMAVLTVPGREDDIVKALVFLAGNSAWRKRLGVNARTEALAKYTWKHHVEAILTRLRDLRSAEERIARAS
jgi:glycosyltransferase involved in cell wall biosynthesis